VEERAASSGTGGSPARSVGLDASGGRRRIGRRPAAGNPTESARAPERRPRTSRTRARSSRRQSRQLHGRCVRRRGREGRRHHLQLRAAPKTIVLTSEAKVHNDNGPTVIDGGGKVTLSGGGKTRILYSNACDPANGGYSKGVAGDCNEQVTPKLTVQKHHVHRRLQRGSLADDERHDPVRGGAMIVRGGRTKIVNARFFHNDASTADSDVGGGAIRILDFPQNGQRQSTGLRREQHVRRKTGFGNKCANGGALSSIGTSWTIINSLFSDNHATGWARTPARAAMAAPSTTTATTIEHKTCGALMEDNHAPEGGSAIFFVSNDKSGGDDSRSSNSTLRNNPKGKFETLPGPLHPSEGPGDNDGLDDSVTEPVHAADRNRARALSALR
jgi:hypothetical protein